jgi:type III restriction enzyme
VQAPKIRSAKAKIVVTQDGLHGVQSGAASTDVREFNVTVPDVYAYIQNRVHLSRSTLFAILDGSGRLEELLINPQAFLDTAIAAIKNSLQKLLVKGIEYHEINGKRYEMTLSEELAELWGEVETYQSSVYPPVADNMTASISKTILQAQPLDDQKADVGDAFSCVLIDSAPESKFAQDCSNDERVRFFFKLPGRFKNPTPLGTYNPDWAVVFEGDTRVYFVAETKSSTVEQDRRQAENLKIAWHFRWDYPEPNRHFVVREFGRSFKPRGTDELLDHYGKLLVETATDIVEVDPRPWPIGNLLPF